MKVMDYYLQEEREMKRVENLEELIGLARQKKSVLLPKPLAQRPWPAAFVINMPLIKAYHYLEEGIYIYEPKKK
jgi:hypothetical protein